MYGHAWVDISQLWGTILRKTEANICIVCDLKRDLDPLQDPDLRYKSTCYILCKIQIGPKKYECTVTRGTQIFGSDPKCLYCIFQRQLFQISHSPFQTRFSTWRGLSNFVLRFQRKSKKCLGRSEARAAWCFSNRPKNHKLNRGRWDLASCQVLLNSVQEFQRRSRKWLSQSSHILLNSVKRFQRRSRKCLGQSEVGWPSRFSDLPERTQTW